MKKRFIALFLCMIMIISLLPTPVALAADETNLQEGAQQAVVGAPSDENGMGLIFGDPVQSDDVTDDEGGDLGDAAEGTDEDTAEDTDDTTEGEVGSDETTDGEESDVEDGSDMTEETEEGSETLEGENEDFDATMPMTEGEDKVDTWLAYEDFIRNETLRAWNDPAFYVGYTATFNLEYYSSYDAATGFDENGDPVDLTYINAANVAGLSVELVDYYVEISDEEDADRLWFKVALPEEQAVLDEYSETLPNSFYVCYHDERFLYDPPMLLIQPRMAMFRNDTSWIQVKAEAACKNMEVDTTTLPDFFEVTPVSEYRSGTYSWYYDLGDVTAWGIDAAYHYAVEADITLIPPEVTVAYDKLMSAEDVDEFDEIFESIPESIRAQLTHKHLENLEEREQQLIALENVEYTTTVMIGEVEVPVTVIGKIPTTGVSLFAEVVADEEILNGGFGITDATDIVAALDIKMVYEDGTEWQPEEGKGIVVSIGVGALGYDEGEIFKLHHKHGEEIETFNIFGVIDGALTVGVYGFSFFVVTEDYSTSTDGDQVRNNNTYHLTVGEEYIFYARPEDNWGDEIPLVWETGNYGTKNPATWAVTDTSGAIYYTVHSQTAIGNEGMLVRWIKIVALKETSGDTNVTLKFTYRRNNANTTETYTLDIDAPKANRPDSNTIKDEKGTRRLYLKDDVNLTGRIVATLVNENGDEISGGLDGAAFSWERSDDKYIIPFAYSDNYRAVNIARDHGGLTEARRAGDGRLTYTVTATLSDGTVLEADYMVYYQSEILNANFEAPGAPSGSYTFFPNGWEELYWETTAPGGGGNLTKDIEYGDVTGLSARNPVGDTLFGVWRAADADATPAGRQFAELNAEAFGALYQDIITAPGEEIEWEFAHAPRTVNFDNGTVGNRMFIIVGATEDAQRLTLQDQLEDLGTEAKDLAGANNTAFYAGEASVEVEFYWKPDDAGANVAPEYYGKYTVWCHDAGQTTPQNNRNYQNNPDPNYAADKNYGWTNLAGSYEVPEGQYRTRLFFVSDSTESTSNFLNAGNLIDKAKAGQYKSFLIEYYVQHYEGTEIVNTHRADYDEIGRQLIYSSYELANYDHFINVEKDFLYKVLINGENYPYDLRYSGDPTLYIEKYAGTATNPDGSTNPKYANYDIVMQVFLRDTIVGAVKEIWFPTTLTEEQKLKIIDDFNTTTVEANKGYKATMTLTAADKKSGVEGFENSTYTFSQNATASIISRDPNGNYRAYIAMGDRMELNHYYQLTEASTSEIPGLVLTGVAISGQLYMNGSTTGAPTMETVYYPPLAEGEVFEPAGEDEEDELVPPVPAVGPFESDIFYITNNHTAEVASDDVKIADIKVINRYEEKLTKVNYVAVGNGKVRLNKTGADFEDKPHEYLRYYSGVADGGKPVAAPGAKFVGWYTHPSCEEQYKVQSKDGVTDSNGVFRPNANIIMADEVTFYAKFETGSVVIERTNGEPGQTFVYRVQRSETTNEAGKIPALDIYVSLTCDENGYGKTEILEAALGTYTVTEMTDWSWRYQYTETPNNDVDDNDPQQQKTHPSDQLRLNFLFTGGPDTPYWLNGLSEAVKNVKTKFTPK